MAKEHSCATIERTQSLPMTKTTAPDYGRDAHTQALTLVAEVYAEASGAASRWHGFAWRLIDGTVDLREEFVRLGSKTEEQMLDECAEFHGWDDKTRKAAGRSNGEVGSVFVEISRMRTIARAFNAGASVEGLAAFFGVDDPRNIGVRRVYAYAQTFAKGKAGRKEDTLLVQFGAWLSKQEKKEWQDADAVTLKRLTQFANTLKA